MYISTIVLTLIAFGIHPLQGQDTVTTESSWWLDVSAGVGAISDFATTLTGEVRLSEGYQLFTLRLLYSKEAQLIFPIELPSPREQELNVSFLYGRAYSFHLLRMLFPFPIAIFLKRETDYSISASLGVGGSWNLLRGGVIQRGFGPESKDIYVQERKFSFSVPLQVEIVQYFTPSLGYVHRFYYNFGRVRNPWGFLWGIQLRFDN